MSKKISFKLYEKEIELSNTFISALRTKFPNETIDLNLFAKQAFFQAITAVLSMGSENLKKIPEGPKVSETSSDKEVKS